jgi:metal-responsive CopG/Arc/MetJ family transcriptional regulator
MKTAISVPDDVFKLAEEFAHQKKMSRSKLFSIAVKEYVAQYRREDVTARLNSVYDKIDSSIDSAALRIQGASIPKEKW